MTSILFLMISGLGWNLFLSCSTTSVTSCLCFSYFLLFIILKGNILITTKRGITSTNLTMQDSIFCFSTYPPSSSSHSSLVCLTLPGTGYSNTCEDIDPKLNLSQDLLHLHSVKSWCEGFIDREDVAGLYLLGLGVLDQDPLAGLAHRQGLQCPGQLSEEETIKHWYNQKIYYLSGMKVSFLISL